MPVNFIKNHTSIFTALMMVLLLFGWFSPTRSDAFLQVDFWFAWLFAMITLALPVLYLEVALAKRSKQLPLAALPVLTRQADAAQYWRISGWLGAFMLTLLAVGMADGVSKSALALIPSHLEAVGGSYKAALWLLMVSAACFALSFLKTAWLVVLASVLGLVAVVFGGVDTSVKWQLTSLTFGEWQLAAALALVGTGLGAGAYWQLSLGKAHGATSLSLVLPVWIAQVVTGFVFALFHGVQGDSANIIYTLALLCGSAALFSLLREQLSIKKGWQTAFFVLTALSFIIWSLPLNRLYVLSFITLVGFSVCILLALFSGWKMKISHLRKALQFDSETTYNIWRVAIRLVVPLGVMLACFGLVRRLL